VPSELGASLTPVVEELRATNAVVYERRDDSLVALGDAIGTEIPPDLEPIAAAALIEGRAVQVVAEAGIADPVSLAELQARGFGALLAVPIVAEGQTVGALEIYAAEPRPWSRYDVHRTRIVGHQLSAAIRRLCENPLPVPVGGATASTGF
jgi:GAF domain-containing protein